MSWVAVAIGGSAGLNFLASGKAADAQQQSTQAGIAEQRRQFDTNRADLAPYRSAGQSALQALLVRLGLSPGPTGSGAAPDRAAFTKNVAAVAAHPIGERMTYEAPQPMTKAIPASSTFDQAGFDAAMQAYNAGQAGASSSDPNFGSLLKPFTGADLAQEPGYQFGLTEGEKQIKQLQANRGGYFSGAAGKELTRYGQDYAGTKYDAAYNRDSQDKSRTANLLTGVSNQGMGATSAGIAAGQNSANTISDLMTQGGNAQASGYIGQGNAINSGVGNFINWQNQSRMMDLLRSPSYGKVNIPTM
jgi:hypothetical protein